MPSGWCAKFNYMKEFADRFYAVKDMVRDAQKTFLGLSPVTTNGAAKGERARIKRILCGDKPRVVGQNGASSNDMILDEYNRAHGGEYTTEADFEQLVYELLDSHAAFERWRKEGAETAEERAYREMEENENLTKFDPEELEAAGVAGITDAEMAELFSRGKNKSRLQRTLGLTNASSGGVPIPAQQRPLIPNAAITGEQRSIVSQDAEKVQ